MKKKVTLLTFLSLLSFSLPFTAQEKEKPVVEVASDNLGEATDKFQEHFFEALKQKAIENHEKAINSLVQCLTLNPTEAVVYLELGKNFNALKDYSQAAAYLEKGRKAAPANEGMLEELYTTYYANKEFEQALPVVKELSRLDPSFSEDLVNLYILDEQYQTALELLDSLDATRGSSTYREGLRRQIYARTNDTDAQIADLEHSIAEDPGNEKNYLNLIFVYSENSNPEKAFETAKELLAVHPDSELVHLALYKFYMSNAEPEKAVNSMRILLGSREIDEVTKYQALNDFLLYVTENPALEDDLVGLVQVFSEDEDNTKVFRQLGTFFLEKGKKEQALTYFEVALENEQGDYSLYRDLINLKMEMNSFQEAAVLTERALEIFPTQSLLYLLRGNALNYLAEFEKAKAVFETGVDFVIDNQELEARFYRGLSESYNGLGNSGKAAEYQKKAEETENKKS